LLGNLAGARFVRRGSRAFLVPFRKSRTTTASKLPLHAGCEDFPTADDSGARQIFHDSRNLPTAGTGVEIRE
jgi:hypothetical protein